MVGRIVEELKKLRETEAIVLGGSRGKGTGDSDSDYDLYVYLKEELSTEKRRSILKKYCSYMEIKNNFWEEEDDCTMSSGIDIELIYRRIEDIEGNLGYVVDGKNPSMGYTTCFWDNLINSEILYDEDRRLTELVSRYRREYPEELRKNIIEKNHKLLKDYMPSFYYQIEKAVKRGDLITINHRLSEFLAVYFDIIYAVNGRVHKGEKRMLQQTEGFEILPKDYEKLIEKLFKYVYHEDDIFMETLDEVCQNIYELLRNKGYNVTFESYRRLGRAR